MWKVNVNYVRKVLLFGSERFRLLTWRSGPMVNYLIFLRGALGFSFLTVLNCVQGKTISDAFKGTVE